MVGHAVREFTFSAGDSAVRIEDNHKKMKDGKDTEISRNLVCVCVCVCVCVASWA